MESPSPTRGVLAAKVTAYEIVKSEDSPGLLAKVKYVQFSVDVLWNGISYVIRKRFSEFVDLHEALVNAFGSAITFSLPRKTCTRHLDAEFLGHRMRGLNAYLDEIWTRLELCASTIVLRFFEPQMLKEWGITQEPPERSLLGNMWDISRGGRRSIQTFAAVQKMIEDYKGFRKEIAEMIGRSASEAEIQIRSNKELRSMAEQARDLMLRNGGFQVKLGQAISAQKAILPAEITEVLSVCCDKANSVPLSAIERQVTGSLGRPLEEVFSFISEEPLAAASVAQVHRATLRRNGEEVVVKVLHPGVAGTMRADVAFMPYLIKMVEKVEPNHGLHPMAVTMESMLKQELDMRREGQNRERLAAVIARSERSRRSPHADVLFPRVHWDLCREGLMVQEFMKGAVPLTSQSGVEAVGVSYRLAVAELAEVFGETAFIHGYFHNDLHPGNVLVRPVQEATPRLPPWVRSAAVLSSLFAIYFSAVLLVLGLLWLALRPLRGVQLGLLACNCSLMIGVVSTLLATTLPSSSPLQSPLSWEEGLPSLVLQLATHCFGVHMRLCGMVESGLSRVLGDRFELIVIDHGFHTHLPYEFRMTWCKVWAAVGLGDEELLKEVAAELNLEGDEYKVLPILLCLLPWPDWQRHEFPNPCKIFAMLKNEEWGLPRCKFMDRKMPPLWHLVMRVNGQVSALFQMQYGLSPTCRYEFMRFMTRSALMGLRFKQRTIGDMPVPGCLSTADRSFFEHELPHIEQEMAARFRWQKFKGKFWEPRSSFLNEIKKNIQAEIAAEGKAETEVSNASTVASLHQSDLNQTSMEVQLPRSTRTTSVVTDTQVTPAEPFPASSQAAPCMQFNPGLDRGDSQAAAPSGVSIAGG